MGIWLFFPKPVGTNSELSKMDFALFGQPFVNVPAVDTTDLGTMNFAYFGQPFISYARG